jgi:hypothetical protein
VRGRRNELLEKGAPPKKLSVRTRKAAEERLTPELLAVLFTHTTRRGKPKFLSTKARNG